MISTVNYHKVNITITQEREHYYNFQSQLLPPTFPSENNH